MLFKVLRTSFVKIRDNQVLCQLTAVKPKTNACQQSFKFSAICQFSVNPIQTLSIPVVQLWQAIPFIGSVGRIEKRKTLTKIHKKSRNRRPWYPGTTLKVNIHILGLTKYTIYCKKCSCFSLCRYYAHFFQIKLDQISYFEKERQYSTENSVFSALFSGS